MLRYHHGIIATNKRQMTAPRIKTAVSSMNTCTGEAAVSIPATPPPKTRPSDPANDTLKPPVLLRLPLLSESKIEPDREMIS